MTVRITKPEFNIREKLSELDIPVGNHGTQLMKSSDVAETHNLLQLKNRRKNYFINGDCRIWQRGTSSISPSTFGNYGCDRWWFANGATQVDRSTDVPAYNTTGAEAFNYSIKITSNGTSSSFGQPIELTSTGVSQFVNGKQYTLSFYAKSDSGSTDIQAVMYYRNSKFTNTNQINWEPDVAPHLGTVNRGWQKFVYTFTAPAVNSNNTMLAFELAGFTATIYVTGFQLEEGPQATPFEFTNEGEELALCQRYFFAMVPLDNYAAYGMGGAYSSTQAVAMVPFPVAMRAKPSFGYTGALGDFYDVVGGFSGAGAFSNMTVNNTMGTGTNGEAVSAKVNVVGSGTAGNPFMLATEGNTSTRLYFDAEI